LLCPPPRPSPFPYTTLFRSPITRHDRAACAFAGHLDSPREPGGGDDDVRGKDTVRPSSPPFTNFSFRNKDPSVMRFKRHPKRPKDRKSTRLNSSHVKSSYAV